MSIPLPLHSAPGFTLGWNCRSLNMRCLLISISTSILGEGEGVAFTLAKCLSHPVPEY